MGLGTVQFGTDYGVSNSEVRPSEAEVAAILARAVAAGFGYLDTASSYGNAELLIGRHLPRQHQLRIVSKLPPIAANIIEASHATMMLDAVEQSLDRLKVARLYALLIHNVDDLKKPGWQHLIAAVTEARQRGWTLRIGVSIYDAGDLSVIENRFAPELVQLPLNALDRRLVVAGCLARLKASGVEVHARSLFLQGLLLMPPAALPSFFAPVRSALCGLHAQWAAQKLSPVAGCLRFALCSPDIDAAIVGVNRLRELEEIERAAADIASEDAAAEPIPVDPIYLDPRRWPAVLH
jgi:aryl-alcohol dehydrogenase-like predicted oxidoreductase